MSITPIGTTATTGVQQTHHHHGGAGRKAAMDAAASTLNMSSSDLMSALRSGKTLSDVARDQGVEVSKVTDAMSAAITRANPSMSADRAKQVVDRMMNGRPPQAPSSTSSTPVSASGVQGVDQDGDGH